MARVPAGDGAVYRGWMLSGERYAAMAGALAARGVTLRTGAECYRRAHELPGWYAAAVGSTPESAWTDGDGREGFRRACAALGDGPAVLRDYTKSLKHYWAEAAYLPDVADEAAAWRVASRFRELRGDDFAGGFVVRRFESFTGAEVRTWWVDGSCRLVTAHPDTAGELPPADVQVGVAEAAVRSLALPFVTADLVRRADGRWRIVEIGDGQVSDLPSGVAPGELIGALFGA
ncbi:ATP-grasp domain-containing protein [Actinoplanes sp. NPDC049802]|uniref:ATP-grasp domain-containing protein n=1 Tax=Actinoplanes sp. NPDC049802 TaxID=3154742 RepID=UPI0033D910C7